MVIEGLTDYEINEAEYNATSLVIALNVTFPELRMTGGYELHSSIAGYFMDFPVYGNGNFQ